MSFSIELLSIPQQVTSAKKTTPTVREAEARTTAAAVSVIQGRTSDSRLSYSLGKAISESDLLTEWETLSDEIEREEFALGDESPSYLSQAAARVHTSVAKKEAQKAFVAVQMDTPMARANMARRERQFASDLNELTRDMRTAQVLQPKRETRVTTKKTLIPADKPLIRAHDPKDQPMVERLHALNGLTPTGELPADFDERLKNL